MQEFLSVALVTVLQGTSRSATYMVSCADPLGLRLWADGDVRHVRDHAARVHAAQHRRAADALGGDQAAR